VRQWQSLSPLPRGRIVGEQKCLVTRPHRIETVASRQECDNPRSEIGVHAHREVTVNVSSDSKRRFYIRLDLDV
jgi:hypothetical protein